MGVKRESRHDPEASRVVERREQYVGASREERGNLQGRGCREEAAPRRMQATECSDAPGTDELGTHPRGAPTLEVRRGRHQHP